MNYQPVYLLRKFSAVFIAAVYILPQLDTETSLSLGHDISAYETSYLDAVFIIMGDVKTMQSTKCIQNLQIPTKHIRS